MSNCQGDAWLKGYLFNIGDLVRPRPVIRHCVELAGFSSHCAVFLILGSISEFFFIFKKAPKKYRYTIYNFGEFGGGTGFAVPRNRRLPRL